MIAGRTPGHPHPTNEGKTGMDRRADPWGDYLRRIMLTASLAGVAAAVPAKADDASLAADMAKAETPRPPATGPEGAA